jgi:hypothetical protein
VVSLLPVGLTSEISTVAGNDSPELSIVQLTVVVPVA